MRSHDLDARAAFTAGFTAAELDRGSGLALVPNVAGWVTQRHLQYGGSLAWLAHILGVHRTVRAVRRRVRLAPKTE